jgi:hypothetical protein
MSSTPLRAVGTQRADDGVAAVQALGDRVLVLQITYDDVDLPVERLKLPGVARVDR